MPSATLTSTGLVGAPMMARGGCPPASACEERESLLGQQEGRRLYPRHKPSRAPLQYCGQTREQSSSKDSYITFAASSITGQASGRCMVA